MARALSLLIAQSMALLLAIACDGATTEPDGGADASIPEAPETLGPADRPAPLVVPSAHDGVTALPLVILLHGFGVTGSGQDLYFAMSRATRSEGAYLLLPDGTQNPSGARFWDIFGNDVDDHAYVRSLIEAARLALPVSDVFIVGHSNGAFIAYRLACDSADLISGIAGLAGADAIEDCNPSQPVAVLHIHGTADDTVDFEGGTVMDIAHPSAADSVRGWATRNGCTLDPDTLAPRNLLPAAGDETEVTSYQSGCTAGATAELWAMEGGGHIPDLEIDFSRQVIGWLRAHGR